MVTDPSSGRASGYVLVASSPSVRPEDAQHLAAVPQVTDYLHLESSPGPFFSFYPLPSGSWAAVKRFVRGTRRGTFNRVVIHTLVVDRGVLANLAEEPWLLWTRCRFRATTGGAESTPAELTDRAGDPDLGELNDLTAVIDQTAALERATLLENRWNFLRDRWGEDELAERLRAILVTRIAGYKVILPQDGDIEQLLAVAVSLLPPEDRLSTPWTTHLAPAAEGLFQWAVMPDPRSFRAQQSRAHQSGTWRLPLEEPMADDAEQDGRALASVLGSAAIDLVALDDGLRQYQIRLASSGQLRRWITWLRRGGERPLDGLETPDQLADLFREMRLRAGESRSDPWLQPAHFLQCACASVLRMCAQGESTDDALGDVRAVLTETHWQGALLNPEVMGEMATVGQQAGTVSENLPVAVALALRSGLVAPGSHRQRLALIQLLAGLSPPREATRHPLYVPVWLELAMAISRSAEAVARLDSSGPLPFVELALGRLTSIPGSLAAAHAKPFTDALSRLDEIPSAVFPLWAPLVERLASELDTAGHLEQASALRARYWRSLAGRPWHDGHRSPPVMAMLGGIRGTHRAEMAELWLPKLKAFEGTPGEAEMITALAPLVEGGNAEQAFHYNLGRLASGLKSGELEIEEAVARAGRLIRAAESRGVSRGSFHSFMSRALQVLLPKDSAQRLPTVLGLLLGSSIPPATKRVIETKFCDGSLRQVRELAPLLPSVEQLAARGELLLRVASALGRRWRGREDARRVGDFVRQATRLRRFDAVAAFLATAEEDFLLLQASEGDSSLVRMLCQATDDFKIARLYLRPHLPTLRVCWATLDRRQR